MQYSFVLPYLRSTPIHIPRRDLVVGGADSVLLEVGVVEFDNPSAQAIVLTGGIGGPALRMTVWPWSYVHWPWDYGRPSQPALHRAVVRCRHHIADQVRNV